MTPHRKKCPHLVHFNVPHDWFEINLRHRKCYSEDGKKFRGCRGLLGRVIRVSFILFAAGTCSLQIDNLLWLVEFPCATGSGNYLCILQEKLLESQRVGSFQKQEFQKESVKKMKNKKTKAKQEFLQPGWKLWGGGWGKTFQIAHQLISWNKNRQKTNTGQLNKFIIIKGLSLRWNTKYSTFGHDSC